VGKAAPQRRARFPPASAPTLRPRPRPHGPAPAPRPDPATPAGSSTPPGPIPSDAAKYARTTPRSSPRRAATASRDGAMPRTGTAVTPSRTTSGAFPAASSATP
jgi:hypothetical protein